MERMMFGNIFPESTDMVRILCAIVILVLTAAGVDLIFGIVKAKLRGEICTSWGLKRTSIKVLLYVGVILMMGFVDYLIHVCHFYRIFGWEDLIGIPLFASLFGIFFLIVEVKSIFESADEKTKTEIKRGTQTIRDIAEYKDVLVSITESLKELKELKVQN